jgi:hypothetical protein
VGFRMARVSPVRVLAFMRTHGMMPRDLV